MNIGEIEVKIICEKSWKTPFVVPFCKLMVFLKFWSWEKSADFIIKSLKIRVEDVPDATTKG